MKLREETKGEQRGVMENGKRTGKRRGVKGEEGK